MTPPGSVFSMKITTQCVSCKKTLAVDEEHAGKKIRCPVCQSVVQLPASPLYSSPAPTSGSVSSTPRRRSRTRNEPVVERHQKRPRQGERSRSNRPRNPRRRERPARDPDDIWNQPISSQGAAIPEDAYEAYGLPARRKKKERKEDEYSYESTYGRSDHSSGSIGSLLTCVIACLGCVVLAFVGIALSGGATQSINYLAIPAIFLGLVLNIGGALSILLNAFREDLFCGFMYMFFPFYALFFLVTRWDENGTPFLVSGLGVITMVLGSICSGLAIN